MRQDIPLLDNVRVAAPCPANWNEMVGGERVRYCRSCEKNVYNLSEMSRKDAEELLETHEGRLCIRYYQRADGKIITQNCPVGLRLMRRVYLTVNARAATLCSAIFGVSAAILFPVLQAQRVSGLVPNLYATASKRTKKKLIAPSADCKDRKRPVSVQAAAQLSQEIQVKKERITRRRKTLAAIARETIARKMRE